MPSAAGKMLKKFCQKLRTQALWRFVSGLLLLCAPAFVNAKAPTMDPADDAKHLGSPETFLFWAPEQQVASYRNINLVFPTREIAAGGKTLELPNQLLRLGEVEIQIEGRTLTADEYFLEQSVAGLLVIKDGKTVYERYGLGNTEKSLWVSFSVAKSVTSMLIGAAIQDGYIKSVDEKITDYLPRLKNSAYEQSSIRNVLQMSSGVEWNEDYADPKSDVNTATWDTTGLYEYLRFRPRDAAPGEVFNYNSAETNLAGTLLRSAVGNNLATYLSEKIWKPFGMESDANWMLTEAGGGESGGCCISATLRDYGRLGLFAMSNGRLADGKQVLSEGWMAESTTPSRGNPGYGYFWWLLDDDTYEASGIFGQAIYINARENVVIAMHSARAVASNRSDWALQAALFSALTQAVSE
jgi:CubicO group peptidase (beta-lactamase class C family)